MDYHELVERKRPMMQAGVAWFSGRLLLPLPRSHTRRHPPDGVGNTRARAQKRLDRRAASGGHVRCK